MDNQKDTVQELFSKGQLLLFCCLSNCFKIMKIQVRMKHVIWNKGDMINQHNRTEMLSERND